MLFYRKAPTPNIPPSSGSLRIWFDGKNIDGSNNSTLVDGQTTNLLDVANRGTAGGSWKSSATGVGGNFAPLYSSARPSIIIGTSTGLNRSLGLLTFDQADSVPVYNFTTHPMSGFIVFTYHTGIIDNNFLFQSISPDAGQFNTLFNNTSNTKLNLFLNRNLNFDFTPSLGVRYCLTWTLTENTIQIRVKGDSLITQTYSGLYNPGGLFYPVLGSRAANGTPQNAFIESYGLWDTQIDQVATETWVENYYGALG